MDLNLWTQRILALCIMVVHLKSQWALEAMNEGYPYQQCILWDILDKSRDNGPGLLLPYIDALHIQAAGDVKISEAGEHPHECGQWPSETSNSVALISEHAIGGM